MESKRNNIIRGRIAKLREQMKKKQIDFYVVFTADFHQSEYTGDYFKEREYLSGFTGSEGTLLVGKEKAKLWTDGRYYIQAERQLEGSEIKLFRSGEEGVPTLLEYLSKTMKAGETLGFDGRLISVAVARELEETLAGQQVNFATECNLIESIWQERPKLSAKPAWMLDVKYAGRSRDEKLEQMRLELQKKKADWMVLTSLDDIAWLFNIRGNDVPCNPVVLSYAVVGQRESYLFMQEEASQPIRTEIEKSGIEIRPYQGIYSFIRSLPEGDTVLLDPEKTNERIYHSIHPKVRVIEAQNPTLMAKAVKNEIEIQNLRNVHIKDGLCVTRFMHWLKTNVGEMKITEQSASDYLEKLRMEQEGYLEASFPTIAAYNANAAMMHYAAKEESNAELQPQGFLLVDSGGQYLEGTTDVTRTFALGEVPAEWKKHFTLVAKSMLNLANARFLHGCRGENLDILARGPLWNIGMDYRCGTGHGVGYLLNVHEAPNSFRWKILKNRASVVLESGMVTTDEPGVYVENSHGIRTENELLCILDRKTEYGQFLKFEMLTMVPIDLDAMNLDYLTDEDIKQLNQYHQKVYQTLAPYMDAAEQEWLREYTRGVMAW